MNNKLNVILKQLGFYNLDSEVVFSQFKREEDDTDYDVWRIDIKGSSYVLKCAKEYELEFYQSFCNENVDFAPHFYGSTNHDGADYILLEYVDGNDLRKCAREKLKLALDALIVSQRAHWNDHSRKDLCYNFEKSLVGRRNRANYLNDSELLSAYEKFLLLYCAVPRTLCHDDLLPFNALVAEDRAALIDWEFAGILPYPTSLARLIAHGVEDESAFFYMTESDRAFAIEYYYENLIRDVGISYDDYTETLDYFLFYEYCEWVMLGNRYGDTDSDRYKYYSKLSRAMAERLNSRGGYQ